MRFAISSHLFSPGRVLVTAVLLLVAAGLLTVWPHTVRGTVTDGSRPVAGALVRIRAMDHWTTSDADGNFELQVQGYALHQSVTAWKDGDYIWGLCKRVWLKSVGRYDSEFGGLNESYSIHPLDSLSYPLDPQPYIDQPRPSAMSLAQVMAFISASTFAHSRCYSSSQCRNGLFENCQGGDTL